jgi:hypothetical protein
VAPVRQRPNPVFGRTNPNKTKKNGLDLLGFTRPNQDFSMGYIDSKAQKFDRVSSSVQNVSNAFSLLLLAARRVPSRSQSGQ